MSKSEPKYGKNDKIEYVLKDDTSKSGYSHHCGYCKRAYKKKRLFRKSVFLYDVVEATKEGRLLWHDIPETDIIGIVEQKEFKNNKPLTVEEHKTYKVFDEMKELINNNE